MPRRPKLLFISNLFPARESAYNGLDNAVLLHHLQTDFEIRVLCPKPIFPPWKKLALNAREEDLPLNPVYEPVAYLPKIGSRWNDKLMRRGLRPVFEKLVQDWRPDSILCSWLYPDGCAVAQLAREQGIHCDLITQGSDTHQYLKNPIRRRRILRAIETSRQVICRSADLGKKLEEAGADGAKLGTIHNGIDPDLFRFHENQQEIRRQLNLPLKSPILLYVGNFLPVKNPVFLVNAFAELRSSSHPDAHLVMVGAGPMASKVRQEAEKLALAGAVSLPGAQTSDQVALYMNAADLFCMSSHNEGLPNVILEALACGLPVLSTDVGGIAEVLHEDTYGLLIRAGQPSSFTGYHLALSELLNSPRDRTLIAEYGKQFTWEKSAAQYKNQIQDKK